MKRDQSNYLILYLSIVFLFAIQINSQAECRISRIPQIIPLQIGEQAMVNLQEYFSGPNITLTVQPNDFYSNIQQQYSCKTMWNHQLGNIISTQSYEIGINGKIQQLVAMLGGSSYFTDLYLVYYGINANYSQGENAGNIQGQQRSFDSRNLKENDVLVLEVPRSKITKCKQFQVLTNSTHLQFVLDCFSVPNNKKKILASTVVQISTQSPKTTVWQFQQSDLYFPDQIIPKLNINSRIKLIKFSKTNKYLLRLIMSDFNDYIEIWRWNQDGKQIMGLYDKDFFINSGYIFAEDIDLRMWQIVDKNILILDMYYGIHIVQLSSIGKLQYKSNLQFDGFNYFFYEEIQQILFMGKKGRVEQYEIEIFSQNYFKANRVERYHLYGYEQIQQILAQNRYLYISTNSYVHVIHLTNIQSNYQSYDGSYQVYPELYTQKLLPTVVGFIKIVNANSNVVISACQTHPPFLHLKTPRSTHDFIVNGYSTVNGQTVYCHLNLQTVYAVPGQDQIYPNGHDSENDTLYTNRPGRSVVDLDKFGIGKNLQYDIVLMNHKINFNHTVIKVNSGECAFTKLKQLNFNIKQQNGNLRQSKDSLIQPSDLKLQTYFTQKVRNWLIISYPVRRIKQYYKCEKFLRVQCEFITLYIISANQTKSDFQIVQEQKTNKQSLQQAIAYQVGNQSWIQINLISSNEKSEDYQKQHNGKSQKEQPDNIQVIRPLCTIRYPLGVQYEIQQVKLRDDKLFVLLPHLKKIEVYESLLSFQSGKKCHYFGSINASSFAHPSIYFSPQFLNFDKDELDEPYQIPSFDFMPRQLTEITESLQTIFIVQFNQVIVLRVSFNTQTLLNIDILKQILLDRFNQNSQIKIIVTLPYLLAIDYTQKIIGQHYLTHTLDCYYVKNFNFYNDPNSRIQLLNPNTFAVNLPPDSLNQSFVQIYKLNSLVSAFKYFASWQIGSNFNVMNFDDGQFEVIQVSIVSGTLQPLKCSSNTLTLNPTLQIQIPNKNLNDEPSIEQFYLSLFTEIDSKRHILTLRVSSDSQQIERGPDYPYQTYPLRLQNNQDQIFQEIDDRTWFQGNIFNQRAVCDDCRNGRVSIQARILLKNSIELQSDNIPNDFYVTSLDRKDSSNNSLYKFQTIQGYLLTRLNPHEESVWAKQLLRNHFNLKDQQNFEQTSSYAFSQSLILSSNIANSPECIKTQPTNHGLYFVTFCEDYNFLDEQALLEIHLHSTTGFKSFQIFQYKIQLKNMFGKQRLQGSTTSQKQILIKSSLHNSTSTQRQNDVLFVRFYENIWIFLIINGRLELIETIDKVDFGLDNRLCWMEVVERTLNQGLKEQVQNPQQSIQKKAKQYGLMASMCQKGLYHLVFTVDSPTAPNATGSFSAQRKDLPSFRLVSQQHIDLQLQLLKNKIQLPQHSFFLQTFMKQIPQDPTVFFLYQIVQNFNSFIWKVQLSIETISIQGMTLEGIIKRYNEYSPIQVTSSGDQYFTVLYRSAQKESKLVQFLALYDLSDYVIDQQKYVKQYQFYAAQKTKMNQEYKHKSQVYQIQDTIFILNQNRIKIFETFNRMRIHIQKKLPKSIQEKQPSSFLKKQEPDNSILQQDQNPQLYSQSIIVFVQTPTESNSVTLKLFAIDFFELTFWEIAGIVIGGLVILAILGYAGKYLFKYIQKRRRLVKLQTDQVDDESSSKQNQGRSKQDEQNKSSSQEQENITGQNILNRESQITTSDSPLQQSLLERK